MWPRPTWCALAYPHRYWSADSLTGWLAGSLPCDGNHGSPCPTPHGMSPPCLQEGDMVSQCISQAQTALQKADSAMDVSCHLKNFMDAKYEFHSRTSFTATAIRTRSGALRFLASFSTSPRRLILSGCPGSVRLFPLHRPHSPHFSTSSTPAPPPPPLLLPQIFAQLALHCREQILHEYNPRSENIFTVLRRSDCGHPVQAWMTVTMVNEREREREIDSGRVTADRSKCIHAHYPSGRRIHAPPRGLLLA
eukprot:GHVU01048102.1.p1 GENE.GHVU01048102.1~~GHVU01048102.1.p1  ORF type:complete len:250 (+),score=4.85 GHVU01048102.1:310-1059(+)